MHISPDNLASSLAFLQTVVSKRLEHFFSGDSAARFELPDIESLASFTQPAFQAASNLSLEEYIVLLLALAPHLQPNFLDTVIQQYLPNGGEFPEIGGVKGTHCRGTLPTGETALFILAGTDINRRLEAMHFFSPDHLFARENILVLEAVKEGEPRMSGRLLLQPECVDLFTTGVAGRPTFGPEFPAKLVTTKMVWEDMVMNTKTASQVTDIKVWLEHNDAVLRDWGMEKMVKPGCRALFYGPPGTGKTLTASLLGKQFHRDVYRIDLSQVVSKYIGETEKNLEKIFSKAEHKDWILFFDEADALFGKRSGVQNAHDRYANQEVSYLLQRVEDFPGLIILASNFRSNLDAAFIRRFNYVIHFPMPDPEERRKIWEQSLPRLVPLADDVVLPEIAQRYELSGSSIISAIHYASLHTLNKKAAAISKKDILDGVRKEYEKEERVFP
jgi:AAA+ superfamily predicted ATPase